MKKLLFVTLLFCVNLMSAQAYRNHNIAHEIKFNIGRFLVDTSIEGSYEYFFAEDASIGGTMYFNSDATTRSGNFGIGPNLRAYFGYAPKSGFFVEAFGLYYTGEDETIDTVLGERNYDYSTTALGLGLGKKWTTYNQLLTFEVSAGLGRNVNPEEYQNPFMFRAGLTIGIRF